MILQASFYNVHFCYKLHTLTVSLGGFRGKIHSSLNFIWTFLYPYKTAIFILKEFYEISFLLLDLGLL